MGKEEHVCIIGFYEGYGEPEEPDYVAPSLVHENKENWEMDVQFAFCPLCGIPL